MSYADFDFVDIVSGAGPGYTPDPSLLGPPSAGATRLNSAVTPGPLLTTGVYCREYVVPPNPTPGFGVENLGCVCANINAGISAGRYVGPALTRAYSLRAWVRLNATLDTSTYGMSVGLRFKAEDPVFNLGLGAWEGYNGYRLALTTSSPSTGVGYNELRLVLFTGQPGAGVETVCSGGPYGPDIWYRIRLDVTPISATEDLLEAYLYDPGFQTWSLVGSQTILAAQVGIYAPWSTPARRCGYYSSISGSGAAFFQDASAWIDLFEAASEPV
jgi:hypothetical protein